MKLFTYSIDNTLYEDCTNVGVTNDGSLMIANKDGYISLILAPGKWNKAILRSTTDIEED
jgi:hypothetical protein